MRGEANGYWSNRSRAQGPPVFRNFCPLLQIIWKTSKIWLRNWRELMPLPRPGCSGAFHYEAMIDLIVGGERGQGTLDQNPAMDISDCPPPAGRDVDLPTLPAERNVGCQWPMTSICLPLLTTTELCIGGILLLELTGTETS
ncbi:hypothetical protein FGIG_04967 [Fasciola gigantica]|uniref:Uncharacterized protein n=1 Tax=Fasciola gigantica TaxID=46835 RepID=A0A504YVN1_FASGI|nr:hypothetical protein FGIG_04967 [Fasciola gigantica]